MFGVGEHVKSLRNNRRRDKQQRRLSRSQPFISNRARDRQLAFPSPGQLGQTKACDSQITGDLDLQQFVASRKFIRLEFQMYQDLSQRSCWTLSQVDNRASLSVPASGSNKTTAAVQRGPVADPP